MGVLDILFPKYCVSCKKLGSYICANCFAKLSFSQKAMCLVCGKETVDGETHSFCLQKDTINGSFVCYAYGLVLKKLLYMFKKKPYVANLQHVIGDLFYEALIQKEAYMALVGRNIVFVPIPLHEKKLRSQGYNHAALLAKNVAKKFQLPYVDMLLRRNETITQHAFGVKGDVALEKKTVFLIDDIVRSGATFKEAAAVLKKAGAKRVYGVAFAG